VTFPGFAFRRIRFPVTSAIAKKKRIESGDVADAWIHNCTLFSRARRVSRFSSRANSGRSYGTIHHEIKFTIQEGLDAIRDVIYNLETYDVTTIRASPMWLMARVIKSMGIKWCCLVKVLMNFLRIFVFPQSTKRKRIHEEKQIRETAYV
jgi:hypothetical protein